MLNIERQELFVFGDFGTQRIRFPFGPENGILTTPAPHSRQCHTVGALDAPSWPQPLPTSAESSPTSAVEITFKSIPRSQVFLLENRPPTKAPKSPST